ncbi:DNA polymerase IV [Paraburkholderia humisilvae]|uniref:DNA polymerase IV n=1 Tax=Paraburkholderia humisilvae TaxID=627669 RepID=A0A6J5FBT4_9BURK|nr:DNA polymerase IV [Paraburkholderia humisilvae]
MGRRFPSMPILSAVSGRCRRKVNGVGLQANEKLATIGITTVGEFAQSDIGLLQETFGHNYADWLARVARGVDHRPVVTSSEPKSLSHETTFRRDLPVKQDRTALSFAMDVSR